MQSAANPRWGGGSLIFSCIRRLGSFLGVFRKINIFLGYENFVDIFSGSSQNWTIFRGQFYAFYGIFLRSR